MVYRVLVNMNSQKHHEGISSDLVHTSIWTHGTDYILVANSQGNCDLMSVPCSWTQYLRNRVQGHCDHSTLVNTISQEHCRELSKLGTNIHLDLRMNSSDFGGQRSKVKVTVTYTPKQWQDGKNKSEMWEMQWWGCVCPTVTSHKQRRGLLQAAAEIPGFCD